MLKRFPSILIGVAAVAALANMGSAFAQSYPTKPIRVVVPGAGSNLDIVMRLTGQAISGPLGQAVVVDAQPAGVIPGQMVAKADPDGYTLLYTSSGFWLGQFLQESTPYDVNKDFVAISQVTRSPVVLVVNTQLPVKSAKDLIAMAKAKPGSLNYATGSTGSVTHLTAELFQSMADIKFERIPYKSGAQAVADVIAGRVQLMFAVTGSVMPQVKAGKLHALAVTSAQPTDLVPGVPTIAASGLPGYEAVSNAGLFGPARMPRPIVVRLNQEVNKALAGADLKGKLLGTGVEPAGGTPEQFDAVVKKEMTVMGKLIKDRGIREE